MILRSTPLPGAIVVDLEAHHDDRGFFARSFCANEFAAAGLSATVAQTSISWNPKRHTLRGMHWQQDPHGETKLVRCTRGAIHDVIVDLRTDMPTYLQHFAVELTADNRTALLIPPGMAHGFLTLADDTEVLYQMDVFHHPEASRGARWDDPAFAIRWPATPLLMSDRDRAYPDLVGATRPT